MARSRKRRAQKGTDPFVVETLQQLKAIAHPLRQRILERFAHRPQTTKQVADTLGEKPTRLYHHVHALERAGFIELVETRPNRGTTEKYYAAVATRFRVDPDVLAEETPDLTIETAGAGVVDSLLANLRRELIDLANENAGSDTPDEALFVQLEFHGSQQSVDRARDRIETVFRELQSEAEEEEDATARPHRLIVGWYPLPGRRS